MRGLVLEGGGAKGAFQIGAYKALLENGYDFDGITGTSIGSLNGAMIAQGDFAKLEKLWRGIDIEEIFGVVIPAKLMGTNFSFDLIKNYSDEIKDLVLQGGIDIKPIYEYISKNVSEEKVRESGKDFGLVTFNITDRKREKLFIEDVPEGSLTDYLMASCYLPVFKRSELGGKVYLDGGFADNLPFSMLVDKGYTELVLVRNEGLGFTESTNIPGVNFVDIKPRHDLGKLLDFSSENSERLIMIGYIDTMVSLGKFYGEYYTLKGDPVSYAEHLFDLPDEKIGELGDLFGISDLEGIDRFYMYVLPKVAETFGMKDRPSAAQIAIKLTEARLKQLELEPIEIYELDEIIKAFKDKRINIENEPQDLKEMAITGFKNIFYKEDIINKINNILFTNRN